MRNLTILALSLLLATPIGFAAGSRGGGSGSRSGGSRSTSSRSASSRKASSTRTKRASSSTRRTSKAKCVGCTRDRHGKIKRSAAAKREFMRSHPCPATGKTSGRCPGWVVDHVQALKHGGRDEAGNMQWQTVAAAKAKDRVED